VGRREARATALQALYQIELGKVVPQAAIDQIGEEFSISQDDLAFATHLVEGTLENIDVLDKTIKGMAINWNLDRLAKVDRNILRLALYEIKVDNEVPAAVAINEAVELAKMFSTPKAARFINGILGNTIADK
jgi:N utilization substance protein B